MQGDESRGDAAKLVLGHVVELGLTIKCLLADCAFATAAGIDTMQTTAPMIAPLIRLGKELAELLETRVSYWSEYAMYEGSAREVRFPLAIYVSYQQEEQPISSGRGKLRAKFDSSAVGTRLLWVDVQIGEIALTERSEMAECTQIWVQTRNGFAVMADFEH
jgi:hypothetical protein